MIRDCRSSSLIGKSVVDSEHVVEIPANKVPCILFQKLDKVSEVQVTSNLPAINSQINDKRYIWFGVKHKTFVLLHLARSRSPFMTTWLISPGESSPELGFAPPSVQHRNKSGLHTSADLSKRIGPLYTASVKILYVDSVRLAPEYCTSPGRP